MAHFLYIVSSVAQLWMDADTVCLFVGCFISVLPGPVFSRQNTLVLRTTVLVVLNLLLTTDSTPKKKRNSLIKEILIYVSFF